MNHLKNHMLKCGIKRLVTYADDNAIGFFKKQGFNENDSNMMVMWRSKVREYKGGRFMFCELNKPKRRVLLPLIES